MNYRETTSNTAWRRCTTVHIYNPLAGAKVCRFDEEEAVALPGRTVTAPAGFVSTEFDPAAAIPLLDPETGLFTGLTMTHGQLYQALYSLYIQTATERDTQEASHA